MEIKIGTQDFWNIEAMRYYSFPKSTPQAEKKEKAKYMCCCGEYIGARKMDGAWNMLIKDLNGEFHLRSRQASVNGGFTDKADWIPHITKELDWLPNGTVLIGEIYMPNNEGSRKIVSVLNCLKEKSLERQKKTPLYFYAFDILAFDGKVIFKQSISRRIYTYLESLKEKAKTCKYFNVADYVYGEELWNLYGEIIKNGGEGIVITKIDYAYNFGKRTAWKTLKLKKELCDTVDAFLTGNYREANKERGCNVKTPIELWSYWYNFKTGERFTTNKFAEYVAGQSVEPTTKLYANGWAGAVEFAVMKDGKSYSIGYISGIPDKLKEEIVTKNDELRGKVAELNAMEIQDVNGDGHYTLRHGVIVQWRDDKKPEDCGYEQILNK